MLLSCAVTWAKSADMSIPQPAACLLASQRARQAEPPETLRLHTSEGTASGPAAAPAAVQARGLGSPRCCCCVASILQTTMAHMDWQVLRQRTADDAAGSRLRRRLRGRREAQALQQQLLLLMLLQQQRLLVRQLRDRRARLLLARCRRLQLHLLRCQAWRCVGLRTEKKIKSMTQLLLPGALAWVPTKCSASRTSDEVRFFDMCLTPPKSLDTRGMVSHLVVHPSRRYLHAGFRFLQHVVTVSPSVPS